MPTIPGYEQQVGSRALAAPQVQQVQQIDTSADLVQGAGRLLNQQVQRETEKADTAALLDVEAKLSQRELDLMFNPEGGVYSRKGRDALDITNQTLPMFDQAAEQIGRELSNPRQREQYARIVANKRAQLNGQLNRYEFGQRNAFYEQVDKTNLAVSAEGAIKYANDPEQVAFYRSKGEFVIGQAGLRNGLPPEEILRQQREYGSTVSAGVIQRLATLDPLQAQQYYAQNYQGMSAADQAAVDKTLGVAVRKQMANNIAASVWDRGDVGAGGLPALIIQAESGGNPAAVSPKGALGLMQLMPETAKETARELGIPYDEQRLLSDPQYNTALGTAYLNKMLGKYDGNQALAVAAYNAGPGSVDKWVKEYGDPRKGEISVAEFVTKIPFKETREYTAKIMDKALPQGLPASQRYADGLRVANGIADPQLKKLVLDNLDDRRKAADAQVNADFEQAAEAVQAGGYASVPTELLTRLPPDEVIKLQRMDDYRRKGMEPQTDYGKLEEFLSMPPDQLAQLGLAKDIQPYLSKSDFNVVRSAWTAASQGDATPQKVAKGKEDAINNAMAMAGILTGKSKDAMAPKNLAMQQQFRAALDSRKDSFMLANNGREPSLAETEEMAQQLLLQVKLTGGGSFYGDSRATDLWKVMPEDLAKSYLDKGDVKIDKIPPGERRQIVNALRATGRQASEANIITEYVNRLSSLGVKIK